MNEQKVGLLGGTSFLGETLLSLLLKSGRHVVAFSRRSPPQTDSRVVWRTLSVASCASAAPKDFVATWICAAPIWVLPDYFGLIESYGAKRVVALSSTSRFTKDGSSDPNEQTVAKLLADGESRFQSWAMEKGIEWVILRPTLIYGFGRDKNISEIARFIDRFGFFPVFGEAKGWRQPVHASAVASACLSAMEQPSAANRAYNLSGGETLTYCDMVKRVFHSLDRRPRVVRIPMTGFRLAVALLRFLPRYRHWSTAMAERMNQNLVFDHTDAARDLDFSPGPFLLSP
ncbi:MAG: NAD-dependent epimerase/dehydratase family protein, partial [Gammaproteobacteria bacterium]